MWLYTIQVLKWQAHYSPFGDIRITFQHHTLHARLLGQYWDNDTQLYYNDFRDHDPEIGRYLQSAPIGLGDGPNTYGYAHQNPVMYTDLIGEFGLAGDGISALIDLDRQLAANGGNFKCTN